MFFIWLIKNKHFKEGSDIKGQITPLLILIMVVLVSAALVTINIGRIALDKTYSSNASDAGSLAAASSWAASLNNLSVMNRDILQYTYDINRYTYDGLYSRSNHYINEAIDDAVIGAVMAVAAYKLINAPPPTPVSVWTGGLTGGLLDIAAAVYILKSAEAVYTFNIYVSYMLSLTDSFYEWQLKNYCNIRDNMDKAYISSNKAGLSYVFSNSGISGKLSSAQDDAFNAWLIADGPYNDKTYSWLDKLTQKHTVSSTLDLPDITSYELQHTIGSHSEIDHLLNGLISRSQKIAGILYGLSTTLGATGTLAILGYTSSIIMVAYMICCDACWDFCGCCEQWFAWWHRVSHIYGAVVNKMSGIVLTLELILAVAGAISVYLLRSDNDKAYKYWHVDGIQSSKTCDDAKNLMIVKINEVILPKWTTTCCVTQDHPPSSAGILHINYPLSNSCSTSRFDGGDIGRSVGRFEETYDSSIVSTN